MKRVEISEVAMISQTFSGDTSCSLIVRKLKEAGFDMEKPIHHYNDIGRAVVIFEQPD